MNKPDRERLTSALREHVAKIAADLRTKLLAPGPARERAEKLRADERVAEAYEVWTDLLSRRAAVLWVLKSVYVRVLEDRGLLSPGRLLDPEAQQLFETLAPHLGETAFLRWVYRDLASMHGGLPELFSPQPAEVVLPSDELSRALIAFWRHRDADTSAVWSFAEEKFEGELMGDLYQELDPVVKDRFALCQTPDFVRGFILDRTLAPAIETFGAAQVRLIDPACGSGHFLIDGLKRLVLATAAEHHDWSRDEVVAHALDRVVGIDLNDYACALARTRLIMTAAELAGVTRLADAARFHPHVYWADGLEQAERDEYKPALQYGLFESAEEVPRAILTRSDVRGALRKVLAGRFHTVVANPPYIQEGDEARKDYHREKIGSRRRYSSAHGQYHLSSPFAERAFQLSVAGGYVGLLVDNQFMRQNYGKALIEKVLATVDLSGVVDTSKAFIPHHGTPTVILFGRNRRPDTPTVRAVIGTNRDDSTPANPAHGAAWVAVSTAYDPGGRVDDRYARVLEVPRDELAHHPWSLSGGTSDDLKARLEAMSPRRLRDFAAEIGRTMHTGLDEAFYVPPYMAAWWDRASTLKLVRGEDVRNWIVSSSVRVVSPYDAVSLQPLDEATIPQRAFLWRTKPKLSRRIDFGKSLAERGLRWFEWSMFFRSRLRANLAISYPVVATHNHFSGVEERAVFNSKAPIIIPRPEADTTEVFATLAYLNSSTVCFWMKQVFQPRTHASQRHHPDPARAVYEVSATGLESLPLLPNGEFTSRLALLGHAITDIARERANILSPEHVVRVLGQNPSADHLASALEERWRTADVLREKLVALQEEIDWTVYVSLGMASQTSLVPADRINSLTCPRGDRPFERLRGRLATVRARSRALSLEESEVPPVGSLPEWAEPVWADRIAKMRDSSELQILETPIHKRAWRDTEQNTPERDFRADTDRAQLMELIAERIEHFARSRDTAFTLQQLCAHLQGDSSVLCMAAVLEKRRDYSVERIAADVVRANAVPNHPFHIYSETGLAKRLTWEAAWASQRAHDAGQAEMDDIDPPEYSQGSRGKSTDYLRAEYWQLRGRLDIPKERLVAFTEVPGRAATETLYGWAGWTPVQRLKSLLAIDENLDDAGIPLAERIGVLDGAWRLLPEVARDDAAAAIRLKAELQAIVGPNGPSRELLEDWKQRFPPPKTRTGRTKRAAVRTEEANAQDDE